VDQVVEVVLQGAFARALPAGVSLPNRAGLTGLTVISWS